MDTRHADHVQELQMMGQDNTSNLWMLNAKVNQSIGSQIRQQVKSLSDGCSIDKIIIKGME